MGFQFRFDPNNFLLGLAAGWGTGYLVYRSRHALGGMRRGLSQRGQEMQEFAGGRVTGRYLTQHTAYAQQDHLLGDLVELSKILVEPRFIPPKTFAEPPEDEELIQNVYRGVPHIADLPDLYAPYNIETLSIEELSLGHRAVALLGLPGSGRTTALHAIALWALDAVDFTPERDTITEQMESEERALKADERAERIKQRVLMEERARERLTQEQEQAGRPGVAAGLSPFKRMMPIYLHMANILPDAPEFGTNIDPAEPLMRALQHHIGGGRLAVSIPRAVYQLLGEGRVLLLLDGLDDLPEHEQARRLPWLRALLKLYSKNFIIVAGGVKGYGPLLRMGCMPVHLRAWSDSMSRRLIDRWAAVWPDIAFKRRAINTIDDTLLATLRRTSRGLLPYELTLKIRAVCAGVAEEHDLPGSFMRAHLTARGLTDVETLAKLAQIAAIQLDHGALNEEHLLDLALGRSIAAPPVSDAALFTAGDSDADVDALFEEAGEPEASGEPATAAEAEVSETPQASPAAADQAPARETDNRRVRRLLAAQVEFMESMVEAGYMLPLRGGRYLLRHPLLAAYFASHTLNAADEARLADRARRPTWHHAIAYAAGLINIEPAVRAYAALHPDTLYQHMLTATRWMRYGPPDVDWRPELLRYLGGLFAAPNQYPLLRERIAAALVGTRDSRVISIFERGLEHTSSDVRRLSCLALGALRVEDALSALGRRLNDDSEVSLAAALGITALGTQDAIDVAVQLLASAAEPIRQAVAESLAEDPTDGYLVLHTAITNDDMLVRRAAVWGLRRVPAPWALIWIYRAFLEDSQWYVRSAAQQAFMDLQAHEASRLLKPYPQPEDISWLRDWLSATGGEAAAMNPEEALLHMLQNASPMLREVSVQAVGQLGMADHVWHLYDALTTPEAPVRAAAHRALAEIEAQLGEPLPAPA
jgi:HEAT repeat protein